MPSSTTCRTNLAPKPYFPHGTNENHGYLSQRTAVLNEVTQVTQIFSAVPDA